MLDWTTDHGIQEDAFIQRIEALSTMGYSVLLSNYRRYFKLATYLATFTRESIVIAMGLPSLIVRDSSPPNTTVMDPLTYMSTQSRTCPQVTHCCYCATVSQVDALVYMLTQGKNLALVTQQKGCCWSGVTYACGTQ